MKFPPCARRVRLLAVVFAFVPLLVAADAVRKPARAGIASAHELASRADPRGVGVGVVY
jgi:hypothetical protein